MTQQHAGSERDERASNDNRKRKPAPSQRAATGKVEEVQPGMRQRWNGVQASKTVILWLLIGAVVLTMIVGFGWGGWLTGGSAQDVADTAADEAVIMRLAPICVAQFNEDPARDEKLAEMQEESSFQRAAYVRDQGWATMPGEESPDRRVSEACADLIMTE